MSPATGTQAGRPVRQRSQVTAGELEAEAARLLAEGYRLAAVAAHDDDRGLRVVYVFCAGPPDRRAELEVGLDPARPVVPSLARLSFPASRFEREFHDLFGIIPEGHPFLRRLVLHQHWPEEWHPMRDRAGPPPPMRTDAEPFPFVRVEGNGVYEIPVGPVHAGLIEPGHFRFSVVGETILKMKARLWFLHRGVERLFEGQDIQAAVPLAECISGDSAVAHSLAYCLAAEEACQIAVTQDADRLRALLLELERLYNHVADIGALCNDVGFGLAQARALTLRERLLRLNAEVTGHRLLRGAIRPGHTSVRGLPAPAELDEISRRFDALVELATANTVVMDRFRGTAVLSRQDALGIGTLGVVARASGLALDARVAHPFADLGGGFRPATQAAGDVMARFLVRVEEARASLLLITELAGQVRTVSTAAVPASRGGGSGVGIVEGWRGSVVHRVEVSPAGILTRCKIVDPSFLNWPALSVALADTIVPDFPLANKSFNLSYAGNDL
ncbi:MAG TPA: NADH-quinone oxidoreductase subunit C [Streptosporangiaceae bacterium]|nr:NADH-quinone oxidoreductase subunit C [Streptosporangiaceae bacterium]